ADFVDGRVRVLRGELYFAEGWQRDLFIGGVPRLDALDLAGIVAAVVLDGHAVEPASARAAKIRFLLCMRIMSPELSDWVSVVSFMVVSLFLGVAGGLRKTGDRAPAGTRCPFRTCAF